MVAEKVDRWDNAGSSIDLVGACGGDRQGKGEGWG